MRNFMEDVVAWLNQINRPGRHLKKFVLLVHFVQLGVKSKFIQLHTMGLLPEFCTILFSQSGLESKIMLCDFSIRSGVYSTWAKIQKVENEENPNLVISLSQKFQIWIQHIQYCKIWFQAGFVFFFFKFSVSEHFCA